MHAAMAASRVRMDEFLPGLRADLLPELLFLLLAELIDVQPVVVAALREQLPVRAALGEFFRRG